MDSEEFAATHSILCQSRFRHCGTGLLNFCWELKITMLELILGRLAAFFTSLFRVKLCSSQIPKLVKYFRFLKSLELHIRTNGHKCKATRIIMYFFLISQISLPKFYPSPPLFKNLSINGQKFLNRFLVLNPK